MAMQEAARSASRKLKSLASDAVTIPSAEELAARMGEKIIAERRKLDKIIERQIALEAGGTKATGYNDAINREKADQLKVIERLEHESAALEREADLQRAKMPLSEQQKWAHDRYVESLAVAAPDNGEAIAKARAALSALEAQYRGLIYDGHTRAVADAKLMPKLQEARHALLAEECNGLYPEKNCWVTREGFNAALAKRGKK